MIERFKNACRYRRLFGNRALVRLVVETLKNKGAPVVPSYHDSDKGNARELVSSRFASCSPLKVYSTPAADARRISIVTDSINSGSLYGGVGTAMIIAALLAESMNARLRIITRTEPSKPGNLQHVLGTYGIALQDDVEFVFAPFSNNYHEFDFFYGEIFITTSWWTTAATMASIPHDSIIYLLQEDERMFYSYGDDHLHCSTVLKSTGIRFVINTRLLFDHFTAEGFTNIVENGIWFEPAFPSEVFYPRADKNRSKRTLIFYARPYNLRNLFYFGLDLLETAVSRGIIDLEKWDILFVGKDIPKVIIGGTISPEIRENLAWAEYAELIGRVDLGLCLMYTPHPSYPPLDLAASGAVVVTNRFGNKRDLASYSANIVCEELCSESMLEALEAGIHLAMDETTRSSNHANSGLGRNWRSSTAGIIQALSRKP